MFELFPGNYRWSYNTWAALAAGGEFGDLGLILDRLRSSGGRDEDWYEAWTWLADLLERRAEENLSVGTKASAAKTIFLPASITRSRSSSFRRPTRSACNPTVARSARSKRQDQCRIEGSSACSSLTRSRHCLPISSPPVSRSGPNPTVMFLCGLDTTKEISYLRIRDKLAIRGISCLAIDTPGVGEALRIGKIYTRYDYEVPVGAAIDYLQSRSDVDRNRIGIIGSSLGGYYVARAAAFEPRCAPSWPGARITTTTRFGIAGSPSVARRSPDVSTDVHHRHRHHGCGDEARREVSGRPIGHRITCPFLVAHGKDDQQISIDDARKMFGAHWIEGQGTENLYWRGWWGRSLPIRQSSSSIALRLGLAGEEIMKTLTRVPRSLRCH